MGSSSSSDGKEPNCNSGDLGSIPGWGRSSGEGNGYSLQYSCLESPMDSRAWWATYSPWGHKESDTTEWLTLEDIRLKYQDSEYLRSWGMAHVFFLFVSFQGTVGSLTEGRRRRGQQRRRGLGDINNSMGRSLSKLWEIVKDREACHVADHGVTESRTRLSNQISTIEKVARKRSVTKENFVWKT